MEFSGEFKDRDALILFCKETAEKLGHGFSISRSEEGIIFLKCDNDSRNVKDEDHQKAVNSQSSNDCSFELKGTIDTNYNKWHLEVVNPKHSHEISEDSNKFPSCRRLTDEQMAFLRNLNGSGVESPEILSLIRLMPGSLPLNLQDIRNARYGIQLENNLGGRSSIENLMEEIPKTDVFICEYAADENKNITHLFIAPKCKKWLEDFSACILVDCTYKVNRFRMPLLNLAAVTPFSKKKFFVACAFLKSEKEEDYVWALEKFVDYLGEIEIGVFISDRELGLIGALDKVFPETPHLICARHVSRSVSTNCKPFFASVDERNKFNANWESLMKSKTEEEFGERWKNLTDRLEVRLYLETNWMMFKERFVEAWTDKVMHLDNMATIRYDEFNSTLKRELKTPTKDYSRVAVQLSNSVKLQRNELGAIRSGDMIKMMHQMRIEFFEHVKFKVAHDGLRKILEEYDIALKAKNNNEPLPPCTHVFSSTMGLPCKHVLKTLLNENMPLPLSYVNSFWHLSKSKPTTEPEEQDLKRLDEIFDKIKTSYQVWTLDQRKVAEDQLLTMAKIPRENNRKRAKVKVAVGQISHVGMENKDNNSSAKQNLLELTQTPNGETENRDGSFLRQNLLQTSETVPEIRDDSSWKQNLSDIAQIPPMGTENRDFGSMRQNWSEIAQIPNLGNTEIRDFGLVRPNLPDIQIGQILPAGTENRDFSSLKRNLLEMERGETPTKTRKCSNCGFTGHNKASCQKRFNFLSSLE